MRLHRPARSSSLRSASRSLVAVAAAMTVATVGLSAGSGATGVATASEPASASTLLRPVEASAARAQAPARILGESRLVSLDRDVLPARAAGQRLDLALPGGSATQVRVTSVEHASAYTAWTGRLDGVSQSSFTLVQAGPVFQGSVVSPEGIFTLTRAYADRYWLTEVPPQQVHTTDDSAPAPTQASTGSPLDGRASPRQAKGKVKIGVMFGYTKAAADAGGGKAGLKASAALVISQTNEALANSGLKVKLKMRGLVKAKGKESANPVKDAFRVSNARDGRFDNLQKVRRRHKGDIVHLFTSGDATQTCGGGLIPVTPRSANPAAGASVSFIQCMPYLVATHEIGHNLGADHNDYPGVTHDSKVKGSHGFANPGGNYISVMAYYDPCVDAGVYTCVRVPYFSSPTNTYNGLPLGVDKSTNNAQVIKKIAPRVARYVR